MTFAFPFTFKDIPKNPKDYVYHIMFAATTAYIRLTDNFDEALKNTKKLMNEMKASVVPPAMMILTQVYNIFFTQKFVESISGDAGRKHTLLYSNIPGYTVPVHYGGAVAKIFFYLGSGTGAISTALTMVSLHKRL